MDGEGAKAPNSEGSLEKGKLLFSAPKNFGIEVERLSGDAFPAEAVFNPASCLSPHRFNFFGRSQQVVDRGRKIARELMWIGRL